MTSTARTQLRSTRTAARPARDRSHQELREQLLVERIAIGREQYRLAMRLDGIRRRLYELEELAELADAG